MVQYKEYQEGTTKFLTADVEFYSAEKGLPTSDLPVFMNPRMQVNRDLSVLFLDAYLKQANIDLMCEPLAGSGVRTLRYLNESQGSFRAVLFDANPLAIETALLNIQNLGFQDRCRAICGDAKVLLLTESREHRFDFVDIDPFGSPAPFLNASIQSLRSRAGLLALTATDMPALCGVWPQVAMRKYGGYSIRAPFVHEIAVRLLFNLVYHVAGLNDRSITPLASLSTDHYIRVWVGISSKKTLSNVSSQSIGFIRFCSRCLAADVVSIKHLSDIPPFVHAMSSCTHPIRIAGPLWTGPIFSPEFVQNAHSLYSDDRHFHRRSEQLLDAMIDEVSLMDHLFLDIHSVCDAYRLVPPPKSAVMKELINRGYDVTTTHFQSTAIRTTAPVAEVVDVITHLTKGDD